MLKRVIYCVVYNDLENLGLLKNIFPGLHDFVVFLGWPQGELNT